MRVWCGATSLYTRFVMYYCGGMEVVVVTVGARVMMLLLYIYHAREISPHNSISRKIKPSVVIKYVFCVVCRANIMCERHMQTLYLANKYFAHIIFFFVPFDDDDDEMTIESERERGSVRYYYFIYYLLASTTCIHKYS